MQMSTILLTNESDAFIINVPSMANVKIDTSEDDVLLLLFSNKNICLIVHIFDILYSPYNTNVAHLSIRDVQKTMGTRGTRSDTRDLWRWW